MLRVGRGPCGLLADGSTGGAGGWVMRKVEATPFLWYRSVIQRAIIAESLFPVFLMQYTDLKDPDRERSVWLDSLSLVI